MWGRDTVLGDRYRLVERLGGGAMGDVWRAEDRVLERQVAVKILLPSLLDEESAARFQREARILAAISHPGIVDVHDYGDSEHAPGTTVSYIVMELVDGRPLDGVLAERGPLPVGEAFDIVAQALDALHAAHQSDIVHRDIKPGNLMMRGDGRVTVTDFGIARAMAGTKITASHAVLGTALYVAPEQAEGAATTPASDLYSIGVVCYQLLTGELPFTGETVLEVVLKHVREPAPPLPDAFPLPVRDFVARALAKRPEERFSSAAAMAAAARHAVGGAPGDGTVVLAKAPVARPAADDAAPDRTQETAEQRPRRTRRGLLIPLIIPVVVTAGAGTVLLIDPSVPSQAAAPGSRPTSSVSVSASASAAGGSVSGTPAPGSASPSAAASAPVQTTPVGGQGGGNQAANPPQSTGGGSSGGSGGTGAGGSAGNPPPGGTAPGGNPTPVSRPTPTPARPAGCGGTNSGDIVNVGDHLKIGLESDSPAAGTAVVMGGHTEFGWIDTTPDSWHRLNACNLNDPQLGFPYYDQSHTAQLVGGSGGVTQWTVVGAETSGASYIKDYQGQSCLTDNGAGQHLTMATCTPGNTSQQWWLP